ncbi:MAG: asparagine synthase (glutamine-hydrolyzing) [Nitrososphaerales archaeon]
MCGIGGCLGERASPELMKRMSALIKHRGPDDYGDYLDAGIGIFSNRLSIIDLEGGHQPIFNEDENLVIVFNGEIYNFQKLKSNLESEGHSFKTKTDTEVILHGYEEYGKQIFEKLNGMFALALWDRKLKRLLLARDRAGIKPLFLGESQNGDLVFCSEIKGILAHPGIKIELDRQALFDLISLYYIPFDSTMFRGIKKLLPGHFYDSSTGKSEAFWTPPQIKEHFVPTVYEVRNALEQSVKSQLISDVEVGSFLSGGLDTSTIVAFASKHYSGKLKTFCMGFGHEDDELDDARRIASHFGTDHHEFTITDRSSIELYPKMIWHSEVPKVNTYSWFVNERASTFVKVCLSGLGGDELFFGYPTSSRFVSFQKAQSIMKVPGASILGAFTTGKKKTVLSNVKNRPFAYLTTVSPIFGRMDDKVFSFPTEEFRQALLQQMEKRFFENKYEFVQQAVNAEFSTKLPDDFLSIEDSMSMAHSLENRVPLLDNQLLDLMLPVSYKQNYSNDMGKLLLRRAMKRILPEQCFSKPKKGFSLNLLSWWKGEMGEVMRSTIQESKAIRQYFDVYALKALIPDATYSNVALLWHTYAFHVWHSVFIESDIEKIRKGVSVFS